MCIQKVFQTKFAVLYTHTHTHTHTHTTEPNIPNSNCSFMTALKQKKYIFFHHCILFYIVHKNYLNKG